MVGAGGDEGIVQVWWEEIYKAEHLLPAIHPSSIRPGISHIIPSSTLHLLDQPVSIPSSNHALRHKLEFSICRCETHPRCCSTIPIRQFGQCNGTNRFSPLFPLAYLLHLSISPAPHSRKPRLDAHPLTSSPNSAL